MASRQFYYTSLCALALAAPSLSAFIDDRQPVVMRPTGSPGRVEMLRSIAALPPHVSGQFMEPAGFAQLPSGDYLVFDRRGHTVFRVDRGLESVSPLVSIGVEPGRILL